jgi:hypothetical protein
MHRQLHLPCPFPNETHSKKYAAQLANLCLVGSAANQSVNTTMLEFDATNPLQQTNVAYSGSAVAWH